VIKKIFFVLVAFVILFIVIVALQPAEFRVTRSAVIAAPAPAVFVQVNDFHQWEGWSPWAKIDPNMKTIYEGAPAGTGAVYSWAGNTDVGEGRMTLTESRPSELVRIKLEFKKPFEATNTTEFSFKPEADKTLVTWRMAGENNFMAKAFGLVMNMDKMVGGDFEKGLAQLKSVAETSSK